MAAVTSDFIISSDDGWVAVTSAATTFLTINSNSYGIWWIATGASAPGATVVGARQFTDNDGDDQMLIFPSGIDEKVWIKVGGANNGGIQYKMSFSVIAT